MIVKKIMKKKITYLSIIIFLYFSISTVLAVPQLRSAFYGTAIINGRDAPVGSVITAKIDGIVRGQITVSVAGIYGVQQIENLKVYDGKNGDTVYFYIQTPEISNQIQATETGNWYSGDDYELDLTFTGEETPRVTGGTPSGTNGGTSGSGGSGGGGDGTEATVPDSGVQTQGRTINIDDDLNTGSATVTLSKGDEVVFTLNGDTYSIKVKSLSDFGVLLTVSGSDIIIDKGETVNLDLNDNNLDDFSVTLNDVSDKNAELTFSKLQEAVDLIPSVTEKITGLTVLSTSTIAVGTGIIFISILLGLYAWKKRGGSGWKKDH